MKKTLVLLLLSLGGIWAGCRARPPTEPTGFAIYLLADDRPATALAGADLTGLPLRDQPLMTQDDLAWYDGATHEMELTPEALARVQQIFPTMVRVNGIPFVVSVGRERIYAGGFWTPLSSLSYGGVVIMQPFATDRTTIQISLGYPGAPFFTGQDPRSDPRVLQALASAGKLK
jgi:hypothetical protein